MRKKKRRGGEKKNMEIYCIFVNFFEPDKRDIFFDFLNLIDKQLKDEAVRNCRYIQYNGVSPFNLSEKPFHLWNFIFKQFLKVIRDVFDHQYVTVVDYGTVCGSASTAAIIQSLPFVFVSYPESNTIGAMMKWTAAIMCCVQKETAFNIKLFRYINERISEYKNKFPEPNDDDDRKTPEFINWMWPAKPKRIAPSSKTCLEEQTDYFFSPTRGLSSYVSATFSMTKEEKTVIQKLENTENTKQEFLDAMDVDIYKKKVVICIDDSEEEPNDPNDPNTENDNDIENSQEKADVTNIPPNEESAPLSHLMEEGSHIEGYI